MRLKTLRKERPAFEIEGGLVNGNRIDLTHGDLKPTKQRSNTSFALPTSLNIETSSFIIPSSDNMRNRSRQEIIIPTATQSYQAIETAYREQGIRIRLSPTRAGTPVSPTRKKSARNLRRHTAFTSRNPSRTSSVLQYATTNQDQHHNSRPFSALHQMSSSDFEQTNKHNVSYAQSSQMNEDIHEIYYSPSLLVSEHSNVISPTEIIPNLHPNLPSPTLDGADPDLAYMSSLLQKSSGDSFRDTIRRRAGLRPTFAVHRNPLLENPLQSREKSPITKRSSATRHSTIAVVPVSSPDKIDKDILKHASRIQRTNQSKDYLLKSPQIDTTPIILPSPSRLNNNKRISSSKKPLKSISLEPIELPPKPAPRTVSLSAREIPTNKPIPPPRNLKTPRRRTKSAKILSNETQMPVEPLTTTTTTPSSLLHDESLSLMKTSPLNTPRQTNSFDSGYYDRSSSSGDMQSLTSSIIRVSSSIQSARLTNSTTRRSNTNKRVSFYEEPTAVIVTTATYV